MANPIVTLSPFAGAGAQFFDNNGVPLAGGLIYTYASGTTTAQATYTTPIGNVANSNPIVLDSSGRTPQEIRLLNGYSYKFVLQTATATQIGSYDNIPNSSQNVPLINDASSIAFEQGTSTTAGSFIVGLTYLITSIGTTSFTSIGATSNTVGIYFTATGVGSGTGTAQLSRTTQSKLQDWVSVKDFGATGNGTSDDTVAINNALAVSNCVYFPPGTYLTSGNINIINKSIIGNSKYTTTIKLSGTNTNTPLFINGGSTSSSWGSGGGCLIRDISLRGNWDGSTTNTGTNLSTVGALVQWFAGAYVKIQNCNLGYSYGFGVMCYLLGYSDIEDCHIYTCALNGVHWYGVSGSSAITSSGIHNSTVTTCGKYGGSSNILGSSGVYLRNAFMASLNHNVIEDSISAITLDGNDNRNVMIFENHMETVSYACFNYIGAGTGLNFINNIFATSPEFVQSNPVVQTYSSINNYNVGNIYNLPYTQGTNSVSLSNASPQQTVASVTLSPGTYLLVGTWMGVASSGAGQMSTRQQFAINTSASFPSFNSFSAIAKSAYFQADCSSTINTADGFANGSLSLITNITSTTTFYLYGGPTSITSSLNVAFAGYLTATQINGTYIS